MINEIFFTVLFILVIFIFFIIKFDDWKKGKREKMLGYKVEYIGENVLRGKEDEFAVVYCEKGKRRWFYGQDKNDELILDFSNLENIKVFSESDDKNLILQRVNSELQNQKKAIKIIPPKQN